MSIEAGDWVVRVKVPVVPYESPSCGLNNGRPDSGKYVGKVFRVERVVGPICGHMGVVLHGYHSKHPSGAYPMLAFRKVEPPEENEIVRRIRACKPTRQLENASCDNGSRPEGQDTEGGLGRSPAEWPPEEAASPDMVQP